MSRLVERNWSINMPDSLFSNCVFWLDASVPTLSEGNTYASWRNFSANNTNAGSQGTIASQPITILTNSQYAWDFDGTNDSVRCGNFTNSERNGMTVHVKFSFDTLSGGNDLGRCGAALFRINGTNEMRVYPSGNNGNSWTPISLRTNQIHTFTWTQITNTGIVYIDGISYGVKTTTDSLGLGSTMTTFGNGNTFLDGKIYNYKAFNRVLDSNEVWSLQ